MANRYFAAFGDVWKHLSLAEILRLKPPAHYWETHAGSAAYVLTESPTRLHGAIRFLARAPYDPELSRSTYLEVLTATPGMYPGSARIAMHLLGRNAHYVFCETDPESAEDLGNAGRDLDVRVVEADGVSRIVLEAERVGLNPMDVLVHIDPYEPHERLTPQSMTPVELAGWLARRGFRIVYWYGYESMEERGWARKEILRLAPGVDLWCGDMLLPSPFVYPQRAGAWGCGVVLANMTEAEEQTCARLGRALERLSAADVLVDNDPASVEFAVIEDR